MEKLKKIYLRVFCHLNSSFICSHKISDLLLRQSISQVQRCYKILNSETCLGKLLNKEVKRFMENDLLFIVKGNIHFVLPLLFYQG